MLFHSLEFKKLFDMPAAANLNNYLATSNNWQFWVVPQMGEVEK